MERTIVKHVVLKSIEKIIAISGQERIVSENSSIIELGINDIQFIKIILEIENTLGIELDDNTADFKKLSSVKELINYFNKYVGRKSSAKVYYNSIDL